MVQWDSSNSAANRPQPYSCGSVRFYAGSLHRLGLLLEVTNYIRSSINRPLSPNLYTIISPLKPKANSGEDLLISNLSIISKRAVILPAISTTPNLAL
jgi:hypothetical protein